MNMKFRLIVMNFLQFAVWGAYLISMSSYLSKVGLGSNVGLFYAMQGIVSLFMPAILGIIADKWIPTQRLYGISHLIAGLSMIAAAVYGMGNNVEFSTLFTLYSVSVAFYMPTLGLSNSVAYAALDKAKLDAVKSFPSIRIFGTIGFICSMHFVDWTDFQNSSMQFAISGIISIVLFIYSFTLPSCSISGPSKNIDIVESLGLRAFSLFKQKKMALFFIFSMLLGASLQITNTYAHPFIKSFGVVKEYADTFGVNHPNILMSLSQVSETLCILLIPFFLKRFGIKIVMLIAMFAWVLRFGLFGFGNPGDGLWMLMLSMIVYGVAFDFFNISGSLFVDSETDKSIRSSAQGLFVTMTNGIGNTIGILAAQAVVNSYNIDLEGKVPQTEEWSTVWFIFAGYALVVALLFAVLFKYKHDPEKIKQHMR